MSYLEASQINHPLVTFPVMGAPNRQGVARPSTRHMENTAALLDAYGMEVRYNLMRHTLEIEIPGFSPDTERRENATAELFKSIVARQGLEVEKSLGHLQVLARPYHPVRDWIASRKWDGVDRIADFFDTITLDDVDKSEIAGKLLTRWLVSAVKAVMPEEPGKRRFTPQGVLTFQGPQGIGKTEWFKSLAPPDKDWICTGRVVDPHNRDSIQQVTSFWLSELGELDATFKKSDAVAMKAFITQFEDVYRSAYATHAERIPRRTMMMASVNPKTFLIDDTGNRRWWVIAVRALRWNHQIDIQQLWAQVATLVEQGEKWWLDYDEMAMLSDSNTEHEISEPIIEDLYATWKPALFDADKPVRVTMSQIWDALPKWSNGTRQRRESNMLMNELQKMGVVNKTRTGGNKTFCVELVNPPKPIAYGSYGGFNPSAYKD